MQYDFTPERDPMTGETALLADLVIDPRNARRHDAKNLRAIRTSLSTYGQVEPLVVQRSTNRILGGNGRAESMIDLGWTECSVVYVDLDDTAADRLAVTLNRTAELGTWDNSALAAILADIPAIDLAAMGWSGSDTDRALREATVDMLREPVYPIAANPGEHYDYVMIVCKNESDWANLETRLELRHEVSYKGKKIRLGRVIPFERFVELVG